MPPHPPTERTVLKKPSLYQRQSSTLHYQTFPTAPPRNPGVPPEKLMPRPKHAAPSDSPDQEEQDHSHSDSDSSSSSSDASSRHETPLPVGQLAILAVIALAEQTALNSISPYLPEMASRFPEVDDDNVGMYVGLIASSFALAQFATNFAWGWLSDRVGRKPIVLCGTLSTALCFVAFGFCRTLWQAIAVQALMGLVNGNQGVISTCLGEITDRSNQGRAFTYLPVIYGLGGITGPIVGGFMVTDRNIFHPGHPNPYPYLLPNLVSAAVLVIDFILIAIFLHESLESARDLPPLKKRFGSLFAWMWQFTSARRPTYLQRSAKNTNHHHHNYNTLPQNGHIDDADDDDEPTSIPSTPSSTTSQAFPQILPSTPSESLAVHHVFTRDTILLLLTFLLFQLVNISYNSLYPIFGQAPAPVGRALTPEEIGISLAFAGAVTIVFQIGIFGRLREKVGNKTTYRAGLAAFALAFALTPFIGYKHRPQKNQSALAANAPLYLHLAAILTLKTVATVAGLTSALLLITNSAPSHAVLGTLNGLAQTLSAAGRAAGPFISGSLFSAAVKLGRGGEVGAFGAFAAVAGLGFALSLGIRGLGLEDRWGPGEGGEGEGEEEGEADTEAGRTRERPR